MTIIKTNFTTESREFETLHRFHEVLQQCMVNFKDSVGRSFSEGLNHAISLIETVRANKKKVVLIGNGGSAAIASHQAVDLWKNAGIRATAFNDASLLTCISNDYGYPHAFEKPVEMFCDAGDLLVAISSSGKSINILNGVEAARRAKCGVIGFSGFAPDNPLRQRSDLSFYLPSNSYGIVEIGHLLLLHSIIDEVIRRQRQMPYRTGSKAA